MITEEQLFEIKEKIIELENPLKIILFGSYARGEATEKSDLDLLVIENSELPQHKRGIDLRWYLGGIGHPFDLIINTPKEFEYLQEYDLSFNATVQREGKVLYECAS